MQVWRMKTYHAVHGIMRHGWPLVALDCDKWLKLAQNVSHWLTMSPNQIMSVTHNDSLAVSDIKPRGQEDNMKMKKED